MRAGKGRLGVEANASEWYLHGARDAGERQGAEPFPAHRRASGLSVATATRARQHVVPAEVPLALALYSHMIEDAKAQGAPVDWFALEPLVARVNGVGVSRQPPHPQAARLFYEYLLTDAQPPWRRCITYRRARTAVAAARRELVFASRRSTR